MMMLRKYLSLPAIIGALPNNIANGAPVDAVPVMADFNFIVAQVNANAQPLTTTPTQIEWQPLGQTPTFISTTSFSVPGNLTATLPVGRRLLTVNTGGNVFSQVLTSVFGAVTTITVKNSSGVLDAGLSAVNFGIVNSVNPSSPVFTDFAAGSGINNTTLPASSTTILLSGGVSALSDTLNEWSADVNARFTAKNAGDYYIRYDGTLNGNGANITLGMAFSFSIFKNGGSIASAAGAFWPFASGVSSNAIPLSLAFTQTLVAGDFIDLRVVTPAFTVASVFWQGGATYRRLIQ
jgi:hypothetical protein